MFRILFILLFFSQNAFSQSLLILGDSLSAGYQMPIEQSWPNLILKDLESDTDIRQVINASISGDTTGNGLARLPNLLEQHQPNWLLIELGANDGLRGFSPLNIQQNLEKIVQLAQQEGANVLLMQIQLPFNLGQRYNKAFEKVFQTTSQTFAIPLIPFFMERVMTTPGWLMKDGLHPTAAAQPWIASFVAKHITPYIQKTNQSQN